MRIEQDSPSAVAAKKIFSITHQIVAKGFNFETYSPFNSFDLNKGIITYGAAFYYLVLTNSIASFPDKCSIENSIMHKSLHSFSISALRPVSLSLG